MLNQSSTSTLFSDCEEIYRNGTRVDGLYAISPDGRCPFFVYCDMTNGGWTVIQVRKLAMFRFFLRISSKRSMLQSCLLLMNGIHIHSFLRITSNKKVCIPFNVYFRNVLTAVSTFTDPGRSTYKALESQKVAIGSVWRKYIVLPKMEVRFTLT